MPVLACPDCGTEQFVEPGDQARVCGRCGRPLADAAVTATPPTPPQRRRDDDDWYEPQPGPRRKLPTTVLAAGIIWIVFGGLILLNGVVMLALMLFLAQRVGDRGAAGAYAVGGMCGVLFIALVGGVFVHVGVTSIRGTAKDTLGNGIGSILFGVLIGGLGVLGSLATGQILQAVINLATSAGLLVAGVLALVGRPEYQAWRRQRKAFRR
jgi:hypothetical protein